MREILPTSTPSLLVLLTAVLLFLPALVYCKSDPSCSNDSYTNRKLSAENPPIALLASERSVGPLITWLIENHEYLVGKSFLVPSSLRRVLASDPRTDTFDYVEISESYDGVNDIFVSEKVITGKIAMVVLFNENPAEDEYPNIKMLQRACRSGGVPLATDKKAANGLVRGKHATKKKLAFLIFNPVSGSRDSEKDLETIHRILDPTFGVTVIETMPDVEMSVTAKEVIGMIEERAKAKSTDEDDAIIIAAGGDGTVSAIAGATMGTGIPFGVLPRGTANAFSVALGIPTELEGACNNLLNSNIRVIDGATYNGTPMVLLAGVGFEAGMTANASRGLKNIVGPLAYVLGGVRQVLEHKPFHCKVELDGETLEIDTVAITIATVAPQMSVSAQGFGEVIPDDGKFDITIGVPPSMWKNLGAMASLMAGAVLQSPTENDSLLCFRSKEISIDCDPPQKLVIDGELTEMNPVKFTTLPKALRVIAPANGQSS